MEWYLVLGIIFCVAVVGSLMIVSVRENMKSLNQTVAKKQKLLIKKIKKLKINR